MPGAELHETGHSGRVVTVLESADSRAIADAATELQQLSGVLADCHKGIAHHLPNMEGIEMLYGAPIEQISSSEPQGPSGN